MKKYINIIIFFVYSLTALSQVNDPIITNVSGTVSHESTLNISGNNFGNKNPAAPLIWDNGENKAINSDAAVFSSGWNDLWPFGSVDSCYIRYRRSGFRNMPQPHQYSFQTLAGCHYQDSDNNPPYIGGAGEGYRAVMVTIDATVAANRWYARFYYRVDNRWNRREMNRNNHKVTVFQTGGAAYTPGGGFQYTVYENGATGQSPGVSNLNDNELEPSSNQFDNARLDWINWEELLDVSTSERDIFVNNIDVDIPMGYSESSARSFTMGGYYRRVRDNGSVSNTADYRGSWEEDQDTNWRYFDDAYVDTTWSRVVMGNAPTYAACTIMEPQIPLTWSNSSISVQVNIGRLSDSPNIYLYVFSADNAVNLNGKLVFGTGEQGPSYPKNPGIETIPDN